MRIGFACKIIDYPCASMKKCILKKASIQNLISIGYHNIHALNMMIEYAKSSNIKMMRLGSDVMPMASHPDIMFPWNSYFSNELKIIGKKIMESDIRISMHPGQYTVLNSPYKRVLENSISDLIWHADFLDALGVDLSCKIIIHTGGIYGNKKESMQRFINNFDRLPYNVKNRLALENDEKCYSIYDVLEICDVINIPAVMDILHHQILSPCQFLDIKHWINLCAKTWKSKDGTQKIHYSQQKENGKIGAHSNTICTENFLEFYKEIKDLELDIMLEVKDKNLSCIKCIHCINNFKNNS